MARVEWNSAAANKIQAAAEQQLVKIGLQMEGDIKKTFAPGTGRTYMKGKNKNIVHVASAPGEPPAVDTGRLMNSISTNWSQSGLSSGKVGPKAASEDGVMNPGSDANQFKVVVGTRVFYAPYLEFGSSRMAARPYFRQVVEKYRQIITSLFK